jgi:acyl carrier protein
MTDADTISRVVRTAWLEVLEIPDCDVDENFFDLGGNSLLAVILAARLEEELDCEVPLDTLFVEGTLAAVTAACAC